MFASFLVGCVRGWQSNPVQIDPPPLPSALLLPNSRVLIAGGMIDHMNTFTSSAEIFE